MDVDSEIMRQDLAKKLRVDINSIKESVSTLERATLACDKVRGVVIVGGLTPAIQIHEIIKSLNEICPFILAMVDTISEPTSVSN